MIDCSECKAQFEDHEKRLSDVERRQDAQGSKLDAQADKLDAISRDIAANRAEMVASAMSAAQESVRLGAQIADVRVAVGEIFGAQKQQNIIREEELRMAKLRESKIKRYATMIGIIATLGAAAGSTLLSDQEVASTIWVKWLHLREPWDTSNP